MKKFTVGLLALFILNATAGIADAKTVHARNSARIHSKAKNFKSAKSNPKTAKQLKRK